ncbi:PP2C family protein-serine/threonine phosphatase [Marinobacter nauticus]|uniref:PP2C family protein-serine/threonine phosphatase n=1 Tax=Marinobacter nauticus TaxID=2743 RepID=UPI001CFD60A3|nr:protein phosphatase 2C domain-containing protein [Marinobacter nauticus]
MRSNSINKFDTAIIQTLLQWLSRGQGQGRARSIAGSSIGISTDQGTSRAENQDKAAVGFFRDENRCAIVLILSDGMGGMSGGSRCASLCIAAALERFVALKNDHPKARLESMVRAANQTVYNEFSGDGGTTASVLIVDQADGAWISNIGDSRIYAIREREIQQLTVDDTVQGRLGGQNVPNIPHNALLQYIGMGGDIEISVKDVSSFMDTHSFLLTSDGAHFPDNSVLLALQNNSSAPEVFSKRLTEVAKWLGSKDNLTSIATRNASYMLGNLVSSTPQNVLQIWDAYGDLSLVISSESANSDQKSENTKAKNSTNQKNNISNEKTSRSMAPKSEMQKDRKKRETKAKEDKTDSDENKKPTIQADIFSSNNEKD